MNLNSEMTEAKRKNTEIREHTWGVIWFCVACAVAVLVDLQIDRHHYGDAAGLAIVAVLCGMKMLACDIRGKDAE